jgi:uncharacterized protein (TIGR03437 family)
LAIASDSQGNAYLAIDGIFRISSDGSQSSSIPVPSGSTSAISIMKVDSQDYLYLGGTSDSNDFPTTKGAWITTYPFPGGHSAPFLIKLTPGGSGIVYSTFLSSDADETIFGMVVDSNGNAYVSGQTLSPQFPVLGSVASGLVNGYCPAYDRVTETPVSLPCSNPLAGFITALKPDGSGILWSTLLPNAGGQISMDSPGNLYVGGSPFPPSPSISVTKVSQAGSPIPIDGIVNAASFAAGLPSPLGLASMFVHGLSLPASLTASTLPWPTQLGGASISVGGLPAPILSISNVNGGQQINFQVPAGAPADGTLAEVDLSFQGTTTIAQPARVAPGIFALPDGSGAIQHSSDYSLVTPANPAQPGETVIVYLTGLHQACSYFYLGSYASLGTIVYQGPTSYSGLDQINLTISPTAPSGNRTLTITIPACWGLLAEGPGAPVSDTTTNAVTLAIK